jgi:hypothetical protein
LDALYMSVVDSQNARKPFKRPLVDIVKVVSESPYFIAPEFQLLNLTDLFQYKI